MVKIITLNCGAKVVLEKITHVQSVAMGFWLKAGAVDETKEISGISHFIEHMMFKGTEKRSAKKIAEDTDRIGGQVNAFTGKEATCYYMKTLGTNAISAAEILLDMLLDSKFDPKEMAKEKKVIYEEMNMVEDSPDEYALDTINDVVFDGTPYSHSILGTKSSLKGITRDSVIKYLDEHYTNDNMVISIAGNFDETALLDFIDEKLIRRNKKRIERKYEDAEYKANYKVKVKDIEQTHICLGTKGIKLTDDRYYALAILNNILGGSMSSRLFQGIREQKGLAYSVYSHAGSMSESGIFYIYAGVSHDKIEAAINGIKEEIIKVKDHLVTEDELSVAKEQMKATYIFGQENVSSRMFSLGKNMTLINKVFSQKEVIAGIDNVTMADIRNVSEIIGDINNYSAVSVTNKKINLKNIVHK